MIRRHRQWRWAWISSLSLGVMALAGCGDGSKRGAGNEVPARPFAGTKLKIGVIGNPALIASIRAQRGEWSAATSAEPIVSDLPITPDQAASHDVLVFPGESLGDLVDRDLLLTWPESTIRPAVKSVEEDTPSGSPSAASSASASSKEGAGPASASPDPFGYNDLVAAERDEVSKYGSDRVALPIGASALVLVYRRSAFERESNQVAAKAAGLTLTVPKTWEALDAVAKFLQGRDWSGEGKAGSAIALAWTNDGEGVADATFLARAAALGSHRDQYSFLFDSDELKPRITQPPFVEALERLVALAKLSPKGAKGLDIVAAREAFRSGKTALLIDRAEAVGQWSSTPSTPIGVAPLPGSPRVFDPSRKDWETPTRPNQASYLPKGGGWLVAVLKTSANQAAARDYAKSLAGPETTNRLRGDKGFPMLPVRNSQLGQGIPDLRSAPGVDSQLWTDAVARTLYAPRVIPGLRIPEARGYLDDLSVGRRAALEGKPAAQALGQVADAWNARTDRLGRDRQVWHYRRSLNKFVTSPEPPARPETSKATP